MIKLKKKKGDKMKLFKILLLGIIINTFTTISYSDDKKDCNNIKKNTGSGWLKTYLCKKGSSKLDKDNNFKKGTFNLLKKIKKS
jgi:hypothetical protein